MLIKKTAALIALSLCACSSSKSKSSRPPDARIERVAPVHLDAAPAPDASPPPIDPTATIVGKVQTARDFTVTVPAGWKKELNDVAGTFTAPGGKLTLSVRTDFAGSDVRELPADQVEQLLTAEFARRRSAEKPTEHIQMFMVDGRMGILVVEDYSEYDHANGSWWWHTYVKGSSPWLKEESMSFTYPKGTADENRQVISGIVNSTRILP